jgi:hypothetical protein
VFLHLNENAQRDVSGACRRAAQFCVLQS